MSDTSAPQRENPNQANDWLVKVESILESAWNIRDTEPDQSRLLSKEAYQLAAIDRGKGPYFKGLISSLCLMGYVDVVTGNLQQAIIRSQEALEALKEHPDNDLELKTLYNFGLAYTLQGNLVEGLEILLSGLETARKTGTRLNEGHLLGAIGLNYQMSSHAEQSIEFHKKAIHLLRELGDQRGEGINLNNLAVTYNAQKNHKSALKCCKRCLEIAAQHGLASLEAAALGTLGESYLGLGEDEQATLYLKQSVTACRAQGLEYNEMGSLIGLGIIARRQDNPVATLDYYQQALALTEELGSRVEEAECHKALADIFESIGDTRAALIHYKQYIQVKETVSNIEINKKITILQASHLYEAAKKDAVIYQLRNEALQHEIEERRRAQAALKELAARDPLTNLLNRRAFFNMASSWLERSLSLKYPLVLMMLDIDHFRKINDTCGHTCGDQVLVQVANLLAKSLRKVDLLGHYADEEFIILMPETDSINGEEAAERLKKLIAQTEFSTDKQAVRITVSIGIADLPEDSPTNLTLEDLIHRSDEALYRAKQNGRNCIVSLGSGDEPAG